MLKWSLNGPNQKKRLNQKNFLGASPKSHLGEGGWRERVAYSAPKSSNCFVNSLCSFLYTSLNSEFLQVNLLLFISNNAWVCIIKHINSSIELYKTSYLEFISHLVHQILQGKEPCSLIDHEHFGPKLKNRQKIQKIVLKYQWDSFLAQLNSH